MSTQQIQAIKPEISDKEQVLQRIEAQRLRLRERHARRLSAIAVQRDAKVVSGLGPDASLASKAAVFARLHPVAVAVAAAAAVVLGPKRVIKWAGVVMPLVMKYMPR